MLQEILDRYNKLPPDQQAALVKAAEATRHIPWLPNPGPQRQAFYCAADELFFGGQAGPGKSDLLIGLSLTAHRRSLILRRTHKEAQKIVERYAEILGSRDGWNGASECWRLGDRVIDIGGCQLEDDKQKYKGTPRDGIFFDEITDFTLSQYQFITQWLRSTDPGQRCRVVAAGNPPTRAEGLWVIQYWGPWLDPRHPRPARDGELRWYAGGREVDGPGEYEVDGKPTQARSRTFIRGELKDNPDLAATNYDAVLAGMPEELRRAYRLGQFDASLKDDPWQVIPTEWVRAAFKRWTPEPPQLVPMCAIGVDPAAGGADNTVLQPRHDWWFARPIVVPGVSTPFGRDVAALVVANRRDHAKIVLDMGGGYGSGVYECLVDNVERDDLVAYRGMDESKARSRDGKLGFVNRRAEAYWRFREALDPGQPSGSPIALPEDQELLADLTVLTFEVTPRGIKVLPKHSDCVFKRLGRSPDKSDAAVMSWSAGDKLISRGGQYGTRRRRAPQWVVDFGPRHRRSRT